MRVNVSFVLSVYHTLRLFRPNTMSYYLTVSNEAYSSSIGGDSTSEHSNQDPSFHRGPTLGNYSSNTLTASAGDGGQLDSYSSSSIGWDSTSEHGNRDLSFHHDQVPFIQNSTLGNYSAGLDPQAGFALAAQGSYEYLFNTGYRRLHEDSVCGVGIPYGEVGGSIPPMDPQLDINKHFLRPVVHDSESSRAASARFDPVGVRALNFWSKYILTSH